jgi:hypothetical protein
MFQQILFNYNSYITDISKKIDLEVQKFNKYLTLFGQ